MLVILLFILTKCSYKPLGLSLLSVWEKVWQNKLLFLVHKQIFLWQTTGIKLNRNQL